MEPLVLVGTNYRLAPLKSRESLALPSDQIPAHLHSLHEHVPEVVILSTCNRTEIYGAGSDADECQRHLVDFLAARGARPADLELERDRAAVAHLFSVAAGLDSMILGEFEILGQVREAHRLAQEAGTAGPLLDPLFQSAIHVGKRARSETTGGRGAASAA